MFNSNVFEHVCTLTGPYVHRYSCPSSFQHVGWFPCAAGDMFHSVLSLWCSLQGCPLQRFGVLIIVQGVSFVDLSDVAVNSEAY